jgi:demethylmenaquinone methyltransferase/2-methoxy-6-polyprenyl-1,4-benzoquinol methylase
LVDEVIEAHDGYYERCRWLVNKALGVPGTTIDVGCADAFMFRDIARDRTVEVDVDPKLREKNKGLNFFLADAHQLPFRDESFDVAVLGETLEHVGDPVRVLKEAYRVCKVKLLITVPLEHEWEPQVKPFTNPSHIRFYDEPMLAGHLKEAGIEDYRLVKIKGGGWVFLAVEAKKLE